MLSGVIFLKNVWKEILQGHGRILLKSASVRSAWFWNRNRHSSLQTLYTLNNHGSNGVGLLP